MEQNKVSGFVAIAAPQVMLIINPVRTGLIMCINLLSRITLLAVPAFWHPKSASEVFRTSPAAAKIALFLGCLNPSNLSSQCNDSNSDTGEFAAEQN
jgi:hypothetical protein